MWLCQERVSQKQPNQLTIGISSSKKNCLNSKKVPEVKSISVPVNIAVSFQERWVFISVGPRKRQEGPFGWDSLTGELLYNEFLVNSVFCLKPETEVLLNCQHFAKAFLFEIFVNHFSFLRCTLKESAQIWNIQFNESLPMSTPMDPTPDQDIGHFQSPRGLAHDPSVSTPG